MFSRITKLTHVLAWSRYKILSLPPITYICCNVAGSCFKQGCTCNDDAYGNAMVRPCSNDAQIQGKHLGCYILDGLEQRWCWAHDWRLFQASPSDCEGFLSLPYGSSWIGYSSGAHGLEDPHLVSGCAAPTEGLTPESQLARDPSSGGIATMRSSLPGSKWTLVKILVSSLVENSHYDCVWLILWIHLIFTLLV
jgi:hypothetical protein